MIPELNEFEEFGKLESLVEATPSDTSPTIRSRTRNDARRFAALNPRTNPSTVPQPYPLYRSGDQNGSGANDPRCEKNS